ncbi:4291_t:CDS:2 [Dentiscutata erythropus]|uniref:4291_t:CDS:1 n=1 Tax=Dentiscutata erythropus TaxID=1348616 RepID=A0A9N9ED03_9GLOM|nr:4291_t:CDS:2 [Dentiscutata erythropus]
MVDNIVLENFITYLKVNNKFDKNYSANGDYAANWDDFILSRGEEANWDDFILSRGEETLLCILSTESVDDNFFQGHILNRIKEELIKVKVNNAEKEKIITHLNSNLNQTKFIEKQLKELSNLLFLDQYYNYSVKTRSD